MKLWQKTAATVLALSMSFSFVACGGTDSTGNQSGTSGGTSGGANGSYTAEQYVDAAIAQLEKANTVTFTVTTTNVQSAPETDEAEAFYSETKSVAAITLAKTTDGLDIKTETEVSSRESATAEFTVMYTQTMYVLDDYAYYSDGEEWYKDESIFWETFGLEAAPDLDEAIGTISEGYVELKTVLQELLSQKPTLENGKLGGSVDFKDQANAVYDFIDGIDPETDTIEGLVNEILVKVNPALTVESVLNAVVTYSEYTVKQVYDAINALLFTEYQTNLQAIKDELFANEEFVALLTETGMPAEMLQSVKEMKLDDLVTQYKDMTLNQILEMLVAGEQSSPDAEGGAATMNATEGEEGETTETPTFTEQFIAMLNGYIQAPLKTLFASDEEYESFATTLSMMKGIEVKNLSMAYELDFGSSTNVQSASFDYTYEYEMASATIITSASFTLNSISETVTTIALPDGAVVA